MIATATSYVFSTTFLLVLVIICKFNTDVETLLKLAVIEVEHDDGICVIKITRSRPTTSVSSDFQPHRSYDSTSPSPMHGNTLSTGDISTCSKFQGLYCDVTFS